MRNTFAGMMNELADADRPHRSEARNHQNTEVVRDYAGRSDQHIRFSSVQIQKALSNSTHARRKIRGNCDREALQVKEFTLDLDTGDLATTIFEQGSLKTKGGKTNIHFTRVRSASTRSASASLKCMDSLPEGLPEETLDTADRNQLSEGELCANTSQ